MATLDQQAAAVEAARRIVIGGTKPPRTNSSQCQLLSEQLAEAVVSLRNQAHEVRNGI